MLETFLILLSGPLAYFAYRAIQCLKARAQLDAVRRSLEEIRVIESELIIYLNSGSKFPDGKSEEALTAVNGMLNSCPNIPELHGVKGLLLLDLDRYEEALASMERAIKLNPGETELWCAKYIALNTIGRHEEGIPALVNALVSDPQNAGAWGLLAGHYSRTGRKEQAMESLKKAIELNEAQRDAARSNLDFKPMWEDEDFRSLVNTGKSL